MSWVDRNPPKTIVANLPTTDATRAWLSSHKGHLNNLLSNPLLFTDPAHKKSPEVQAFIEQVVQYALSDSSQEVSGLRRILGLGAPDNAPAALQAARNAADQLIHKNVRINLETQLRSLVAASRSSAMER